MHNIVTGFVNTKLELALPHAAVLVQGVKRGVALQCRQEELLKRESEKHA